MNLENIKNTRFAVLGAGRSGIAIAKLLLTHKAKSVILTDEKQLLEEQINIEDNQNLKMEFGKFSEDVLTSDVIIKSPGIPPDNDILLKAKSLKKEIYSEVEAASWFCPSPIIGITGTNGKTTTTVLIGETFKNAGYNTFVAGNVGRAFSEIVSDVTKDSVVVLELSSFQLEDIAELNPRVSILLNITPDHIDWHKSFENYLNAKLKIYKNHSANDLLVYNYDDKEFRANLDSYSKNVSVFSLQEDLSKSEFNSGAYMMNEVIYYFNKKENVLEDIISRKEIYLKGNHNVYNILSAIIAAKKFGITTEVIEKTLKEFKGVEHRIEFVRELNGVSYYNDSKATNIDALTVALQSFEKNIILILGGKDVDNDYNTVKELVNDRVKEIIAVGSSKDKIFDFFNLYKKVYRANSYEDAVRFSFETGKEGDTVLLSPACKSFDMFSNFEERGRKFKELVNNL